MELKDRRAASRYAVQKPLRYRIAGGPIAAVWKRGNSLDMSAGGILVDLAANAPVGTKLELAMDWTGLYHDKQMMRLFLIASVTRIDKRGTALRILSHRFRDVYPAAVKPRRLERKLAVA